MSSGTVELHKVIRNTHFRFISTFLFFQDFFNLFFIKIFLSGSQNNKSKTITKFLNHE